MITLDLGTATPSAVEAIARTVFTSNSVGIPNGNPIDTYLCKISNLLSDIYDK